MKLNLLSVKSLLLSVLLIVEASVNHCVFYLFFYVVCLLIMLLFNLLVGFKIIARKFTRYFLAENDRLEQLVLFLSGCDQMACARTKEEYHLRIFRPKGLLVIFLFSEFELDFLH